jgi:hypothetical protein
MTDYMRHVPGRLRIRARTSIGRMALSVLVNKDISCSLSSLLGARA